jgi:hypothetical protein
MKKVLAVVIAVAFISIGVVNSNAQVPNVQIYFDDLLQATQGDCGDHFFGEPDELNVVMNNFNTFVSTIEFAVFFGPGPVTYLGDLHVPAMSLFLGTSYQDGPGGLPDGVTITYQLPQNAFDPFICMRLGIAWFCDDCLAQPVQPINVVPHEGTGKVQAVEWQTFNLIDGVGMSSAVCPGIVSTEESSWGQIKALYNN